MTDITLRPVDILLDSQRYFEMLMSNKYVYFGWKVKSLSDVETFLKNQEEGNYLGSKLRYIYSIELNGKVIGSTWLTKSPFRKHVGEISYFVDESFWGKGIATKAVKEMENIAFGTLGIERLTIVVKTENLASEKVAIKAGYKKEGILRGEIKALNGDLIDGVIYAKLKKD